MTAFEILYFNKDLLNRLMSLGLRLEDYKYVDIYIEYAEIRKRGNKITYIISALAAKYKISERGLYKIIKRLEKECPLSSV